MIKIEDIARLAGVSTATVSRVLNNSGKVAPATREAVLNASRQLGRMLDPEITRKRVLIIYTPSAQVMVESFMKVSESYNVSTLYKATNPASVKAGDIDSDGDFDGVIVVDRAMEALELQQLQQNKPVVQCRNYCGGENECAVLVDDVLMGRLLTQHLIEQGRKRIAFAHLNQFMASRPHNIERFEGYHAMLSLNGLQPGPAYELDRPGELERIRAEAGEKWDALIFPEPIEALLDLQQLLTEDGHRIGDTLALATLGDNAAIQRAGITGMRQPNESLADASLFMLSSLMEKRLQLGDSIYVRFNPTLIARKSTLCAK